MLHASHVFISCECVTELRYPLKEKWTSCLILVSNIFEEECFCKEAVVLVAETDCKVVLYMVLLYLVGPLL